MFVLSFQSVLHNNDINPGGSNDINPGNVMQCLIEHKNDNQMNRKCAEGIEHHQLVNTLFASFKIEKLTVN